jgi:Secretion system C-terminal sorting domain
VFRAVKSFTPGQSIFLSLLNGVGDWSFTADSEPGYERQLIYLRIGNALQGSSVVATGVGQPSGTRTPKGTTSLYPNPAFDRINVTYEIDHSQPMDLELYNVLGRQVFEDHIAPAPVGQQTITIDVSSYPAGVYFVRLAGEASVRSFVIIR